MASLNPAAYDSVSFKAKLALNPPLGRDRAMKSIPFREFKKYLGLARVNVVDITVETHPAAIHLRCYDNCANLSSAEWKPVCGWLMSVGLLDGVITAEHHCVLFNGKRYKEVSPHPDLDTITFQPDSTFSPQAIDKLANQKHCSKWTHPVVAGYQIRMVPHEIKNRRGRAVNICTLEDDSLAGVMWLQREDLQTVQILLNAAKDAKRLRNKIRKRRRRQT